MAKSNNLKFITILAGAVVLRLALMPIAMHGDLIFTHYFPHFLTQHGVWDIYGYLGKEAVAKAGVSYYPPLVYYFVGSFQWLLSGFGAGPLLSRFMEHAHSVFYDVNTQGIVRYFSAFSDSEIFLALTWMKLQYLLVEMACWGLLFKIMEREGKGRGALVSWCFQPVILFSVYLFGTYRVFDLFFLLLSVLLIKQERCKLAALSFGVLLLLDIFPWFLIPPILLALNESWRGRLQMLFLILTPFFLVFTPLYLSSPYVVQAYFPPLFKKAAVQSLTHSFAPREVAMLSKLVFVAGYLWVMRSLWVRNRMSLPEGGSYKAFLAGASSILLLFYATHQTLVQYFLWAFPLLFILQKERCLGHQAIFGCLIALLFVFNLDSRGLNLGLFTPLDHAALSYPSLREWLSPYFPWGKVVASCRLLFSLLCLYTVFHLNKGILCRSER